jgi:hypothetical protein
VNWWQIVETRCGGFFSSEVSRRQSVAVVDYRAQLLEVNEGIIAIMQRGQSFTIGDWHFTRANLGDAIELQKWLEAEVAKQEAARVNANKPRIRYARVICG